MIYTISIHAPRAGRDWAKIRFTEQFQPFQSTRPVRGATDNNMIDKAILDISIHAPRAGRDPLHP